jgi:hypothetical protein
MGEPDRLRSGNGTACSHYLLSPDVVLMQLEDGTAQLVDLDGSVFGLSETAAQMLKGTLDIGEQETIQGIAAEYNADLDRIRADLAGLLRTLRANGLVRRSDDSLPRVALRTAVALAVGYPALKIAAHVRNPRLKALALLAVARLSFTLTGWARTVDVWRRCLGTSHVPAPSSKRERLIETIDRATRRSAGELPLVACKERALCCWFMLRAVGVRARLVMGVKLSPFSGHCWCEVDERILTDSADRCKTYTPVICYDA